MFYADFLINVIKVRGSGNFLRGIVVFSTDKLHSMNHLIMNIIMILYLLVYNFR